MPTADPTLDLLARLVDHERWPAEWAPPTYRGDGCPEVRPLASGILWRWHADAGRWLPDPDDHATGGVLYALLRSTDPKARWEVHDAGGGDVCVFSWCSHQGPTLGRACVNALAAAWRIE